MISNLKIPVKAPLAWLVYFLKNKAASSQYLPFIYRMEILSDLLADLYISFLRINKGSKFNLELRQDLVSFEITYNPETGWDSNKNRECIKESIYAGLMRGLIAIKIDQYNNGYILIYHAATDEFVISIPEEFTINPEQVDTFNFFWNYCATIIGNRINNYSTSQSIKLLYKELNAESYYSYKYFKSRILFYLNNKLFPNLQLSFIRKQLDPILIMMDRLKGDSVRNISKKYNLSKSRIHRQYFKN